MRLASRNTMRTEMLVEVTYFGADGKPCLCKDGYAGWKATYDERGNQTSESCFGTDGKPCLHKDGYAGWKATFDERGNQTSVSYFGTDGKPCLQQGRVCRMEGSPTTSGETRQACPTSAPTASPA